MYREFTDSVISIRTWDVLSALHSIRLRALSWQLAIAVGAGALMGAIALIVSPLVMLVLLVGFWGLGIVVADVALALLGLLIGTSTIVPESSIPFVMLGSGKLYVTDVLLILPLGLIILRRMLEPAFRVNTPLDLPLMFFIGLALFSTGLGLFRTPPLDLRMTIPETRTIMYYLTFFSVTHFIDTERKLRRMLRGLLALAVVNASAMVLQYLAGDRLSLLTYGRVEPLVTEGRVYTGVTRITSFGGEPLILIMLIVALVSLFWSKPRRPSHLLGEVALLVLLITALMITFNRNFFVMVALALLLLMLVALATHRLDNRLVGRVLAWVLVCGVFIGLIMTLVPASSAAQLLDATFERISSLAAEDTYTRTGGSLRSRDVENEYALDQIARHPVWGLGLGAAYRPYLPGIDDPSSAKIMPRYVHNAHLAFLVKAGIPAYLSFVTLSGLFISRGFRHWPKIAVGWQQVVVLGFTFTYVGLLLATLVNPILVQWFWTPVLGIMWGINEVILRRALSEHKRLSAG